MSERASRQLGRLLERAGEARTLTITKTKSGAWRATVGFRGVSALPLPANTEVGALDRGIAVTAALPDGTHLVMPGFLAEARETIAVLQRQRASHKVRSPEWRKLNRAIAKAYAKAHHQSENWARHAARAIVARYGVIALEDLELANMTKSAKGTPERPGKGVAAKSELNRNLLGAALGRLAYWVSVKAEEAGRRVYLVNPVNSSRECAACGHTAKENRHRSRFHCIKCGHVEHADTNAAQVLATRGQAADASWRHQGSPRLKTPTPRNLRRRDTDARSSIGDGVAPRAGSARHAAVA